MMKKIIVFLSFMVSHLSFSQLNLPDGAELYVGETIHIDAFNEDYYIGGNPNNYNLEIGYGNTIGSNRAIVINDSKNVGIGGIGNPKVDLHVGSSYINYTPSSDVLAIFEGSNFSTVNISGTVGSVLQFGNQSIANKVELAYEQWSVGLKFKFDGTEKVILGGSSYDLDVKGAGLFTGNLLSNGNVGIGTTSPQSKLHVTSGVSGDAVFILEADTDNNNEADNPIIQMRQDGDIIGANIGFSENFGENKFGIGTRYTNSGGEKWDTFIIDIASNKIGIGTNSPDSKLTVKGNIHSNEVKVDLLGAVAPDYVFNEDYNLKSINEVQNYITKNGHLPNIPSAKDMEDNGINLKEMNLKLLEKIEELTLYTIDQENRIEKLEEKNKRLIELVEKLIETNIEK